MDSDTQVAEMTRATEAMKLEVADTIASLSQMALSSGGGGSGEDGKTCDCYFDRVFFIFLCNMRVIVVIVGDEMMMGPTAAELDNTRDQLDQAQEELVVLMERCDRLELELEVARKKNRVYQVGSRVILSILVTQY